MVRLQIQHSSPPGCSTTCVPVKTKKRGLEGDLEKKRDEQKPTREEEMAVSEQTALEE